MEDEAQPNPIGPTPWRFFGDFLGVQKVTRRRGGEIPAKLPKKQGGNLYALQSLSPAM